MTRKEEIQKEARVYSNNSDSSIIESITSEQGFIDGALWADKTMLDKVCNWLEKNVTFFDESKGRERCIVNLYVLRAAMIGEE